MGGACDYEAMLEEFGVTDEHVRAISERTSDLVGMPEGFGVEVRRSGIEGLGVFVLRDFEAGEEVGPARIGVFRTPVGRYCNHSGEPNCVMTVVDVGIMLVALRGLRVGEEATVDYRDCRRAALELDARG